VHGRTASARDACTYSSSYESTVDRTNLAKRGIDTMPMASMAFDTEPSPAQETMA